MKVNIYESHTCILVQLFVFIPTTFKTVLFNTNICI